MLKVKLIDLVGKPVFGIKANVVRQGGKFHYDYQDKEMIRELISVEIKKKEGKKWIYWHWKTEPCEISYFKDCGYSAIADSEDFPFNGENAAYIFIESLPV